MWLISIKYVRTYFPDTQEDEDKSVEGDKDNAGKEDAMVDVVTPADIPAFYSRQVLILNCSFTAFCYLLI